MAPNSPTIIAEVFMFINSLTCGFCKEPFYPSDYILGLEDKVTLTCPDCKDTVTITRIPLPEDYDHSADQ